MRLYSMTGTCALSVHIALEWAGAPYELAMIDHGDNRGDAFLQINPSGKVPTVVLDNGDVLTEAAAILTWIVDSFPAADLGASTDHPLERFRLAETLSFLTGEVHPAFGPFFAPANYAADETQFDALKAKSLERAASYMVDLDTRLETSNWLVGGRRSVADTYLYVLARWAENLPGGLRQFPKLTQFAKRMEADDAVASAIEQQALLLIAL